MRARKCVLIWLGAFSMYSLAAASSPRLAKPRRYSINSSSVASPFSPLGFFGPSAVQNTPSSFRCLAHVAMIDTTRCSGSELASVEDQPPILSSEVPSRFAKFLIASASVDLRLSAHSVGCRGTLSTRTSVSLLRLETRANSIGNIGPSTCQSSSIARSRGSQMREPHPMTPILNQYPAFQLCTTGASMLSSIVWM